MIVTRNAFNRISETLNTTIELSSTKESNFDCDESCNKFSNPRKDRMNRNRLSNRLTSAWRSPMNFDEFRIEGELNIIEEYTIIPESKMFSKEYRLDLEVPETALQDLGRKLLAQKYLNIFLAVNSLECLYQIPTIQ